MCWPAFPFRSWASPKVTYAFTNDSGYTKTIIVPDLIKILIVEATVITLQLRW